MPPSPADEPKKQKRARRKRAEGSATEKKRSVAPEDLPDVYQQALHESATALNVVNRVLDRELDEEGMGKLLRGLGSGTENLFMDKLGEMLRQTSALFLVSRRMSDSLSLDVLLPRVESALSPSVSGAVAGRGDLLWGRWQSMYGMTEAPRAW